MICHHFDISIQVIRGRDWIMVLNATFNNIMSVSFIGVGSRSAGQNHRPGAIH